MKEFAVVSKLGGHPNPLSSENPATQGTLNFTLPKPPSLVRSVAAVILLIPLDPSLSGGNIQTAQ
jgi:hypothetical protein